MFFNIIQNCLRTVFIISCFLQFHHAFYRFKMPMEGGYCPPDEPLCTNEKPHFLCARIDTFKPPPKCAYKGHDMAQTDRKIFVQGHNGIRNKVAMDFNIANMNIIYWSDQLERMAIRYLQTCVLAKDTCSKIGGNNLNVNQNTLFRERKLIDRWPGRVVRTWYREVGYIDNLQDYYKRMKSHPSSLQNFTQMIWPSTEFIGCGIAGMYRGYYVVCYYHPPATAEIQADVQGGSPCTLCPRDRPTCSRTFGGLCGLDLDMNSAVQLKYNKIYFMLLVLVFCIL